MSTELKHEVQILFAEADILAMIEDQVCGNYGTFKFVRPYAIEAGDNGFLVSFSAPEGEPAEAP